jgi:DNA-binding transcriptional ArsR family regulator
MVYMDTLSSTLYALADPTRRAILARLSRGGTTLSELAQPFAMTVPAVAKHVKVLESAGLVHRGARGPTRPIHLQARALREVADWVERYRGFWEGSFDRLGVYLARSGRGRRRGR